MFFGRAGSQPTYRILVPIGGNSADDAAVQLACDMAKQHKGQVQAVYVIEVVRALPLDAELSPELQKGEALLQQADATGSAHQVEIATELLQAREAGPAIVDEACERGVQLIVMGLPYKRRFGEFSMGRTIPYVLRNAPCQVWICREPSAAGG